MEIWGGGNLLLQPMLWDEKWNFSKPIGPLLVAYSSSAFLYHSSALPVALSYNINESRFEAPRWLANLVLSLTFLRMAKDVQGSTLKYVICYFKLAWIVVLIFPSHDVSSFWSLVPIKVINLFSLVINTHSWWSHFNWFDNCTLHEDSNNQL